MNETMTFDTSLNLSVENLDWTNLPSTKSTSNSENERQVSFKGPSNPLWKSGSKRNKRRKSTFMLSTKSSRASQIPSYNSFRRKSIGRSRVSSDVDIEVGTPSLASIRRGRRKPLPSSAFRKQRKSFFGTARF